MTLLPSSIADKRFLALQELVFRNLPLEALDLLYDPKLCLPAAFPALGDQLGVRDPAWHLLKTDTERRKLLEQAIQLQKTRGTPAGLKGALAAVGYPGMTIKERTRTWAHFRLELPPGHPPLTPQAISLLLPLVEAWKPARCVLEGWTVPIALISAPLPDAFPIRYDGAWSDNGARFYEGDPLESAYALVGQGTPTVRVSPITFTDPEPGKRVASFTVPEEAGNGLLLDCSSLYTQSGRLIAASSMPSTQKTAAITLPIQWTFLKG